MSQLLHRESTERYECPACAGDGYVDRWGDETCETCCGTGRVFTAADVKRLVEEAMDFIVQEDVLDREVNVLHVCNVIENTIGYGVRPPYGQVRHALGRHPRATYLRSVQSLGSALPYYRIEMGA